jgi:hypothetical protein
MLVTGLDNGKLHVKPPPSPRSLNANWTTDPLTRGIILETNQVAATTGITVVTPATGNEKIDHLRATPV